MLQIEIPEQEYFDNQRQEFVTFKAQRLQLEHSLVSLSKWESKWKKPFLGKDSKTEEESLDYVRCMTMTQNVDDKVYSRIPASEMKKIEAYIDDPMTATTFREDPNSQSSKTVITSEIIYYWMISFNIPFECRKWHLNTLLTLIRVCSIKNSPKKKMSRKAQAQRNSALNASRKSRLNTRG